MTYLGLVSSAATVDTISFIFCFVEGLVYNLSHIERSELNSAYAALIPIGYQDKAEVYSDGNQVPANEMLLLTRCSGESTLHHMADSHHLFLKVRE